MNKNIPSRIGGLVVTATGRVGIEININPRRIIVL